MGRRKISSLLRVKNSNLQSAPRSRIPSTTLLLAAGRSSATVAPLQPKKLPQPKKLTTLVPAELKTRRPAPSGFRLSLGSRAREFGLGADHDACGALSLLRLCFD